MPSATARWLCPDLVFVKPRFEAYKTVSAQIRSVFEGNTALVEPAVLDEAYLDVTENRKSLPSATAVTQDIRATIRSPASSGTFTTSCWWSGTPSGSSANRCPRAS